jgi:hypothetical protein
MKRRQTWVQRKSAELQRAGLRKDLADKAARGDRLNPVERTKVRKAGGTLLSPQHRPWADGSLL